MNNPHVMGIDPGLSGAVARIFKNGIQVADMPTYKDGKQTHIDAASLSQIIESEGLPDVCVLERVHSMPGQSAQSGFTFGRSVGVVMGVLGARRVSLVQVTPQMWKKHFGLSSDKQQARGLAIQRFPLIAECLNRKKDADRAEALLIAQWYLETR